MTRHLHDPLQERETERAFVLEFMLFVAASLLALALCAFWGGSPKNNHDNDNDNDNAPDDRPEKSMPTTTKKNP